MPRQDRHTVQHETKGAEMTSHAFRATTTEAAMEVTIRQSVEYRGGTCLHARDSRGLNIEGLPDLICICPPQVWFIELKSQRRTIRAAQRWVLDLLFRCHHMRAAIVRPHPKPGELSLDELLDALDEAA